MLHQFIDIRVNQETALEQFSDEFKTTFDISMLSTVGNACPNNNYTIIEGKLAECYENAFITKSAKFNRKKHCYNKWMTTAILKSVNYKTNYIKL